MTAPAEKATLVWGGYEILGLLGKGGMATVHLGAKSGPFGFSKLVAIKRLHDSYASDRRFVEMLIDEARISAHIRHPNVVATLDLLDDVGQVLVVLDYVEGASLSALMRASLHEGTLMPVPVVLALASGALAGLAAAHQAKDASGNLLRVVHRDVSPQNIIVGSDGVPRLADFGIAKAVGRIQSTSSRELKGKLGYMAPEQIMGNEVGPQADLFSLGVVLWEMLVGRRLFDGDSEGQTLEKTLHLSVAAPSTLRAGISPELDALVLRALERLVDQRFASAEAMADELSRCGPPAPASEVASWVERWGHELIDERRALAKSAHMSSHEVATVSLTPSRGRRRRGVALAAVAGVLAAGFGMWRWTRPAPATVAPIVEAAPVEAPAEPPAAPSVAPTAHPVPAAVKPVSHRVKKHPAVDCNPPYLVTADGHKHFKPECLE